MSSTLDLPNEVTLRILQFCFVVDISTLIDCLQVCKRWYRLGCDLPWKDLYIDDVNAWAIFSTITSASRNNLGRIRSITTNLGVEDPESAIQILPLLFAQLHKMRNLESVSSANLLGQFPESGRRAYVAWSQCLLAVPSTIKYLELGGSGGVRHDNTAADEHFHLCAYIRNLLPQLRQLRIEQYNICAGLFDVKAKCDELEAIYIDTYKYIMFKKECGAGEEENEEREEGFKEVIEAGKKAVRKGLFPKLSKFMVYGKRCNEYEERQSSYSCHYAIDLIANTTTTYPIAKCAQGNEWLRYQETSTSGQRDLLAHHLHDQYPDIIEGPTWSTSDFFVRLPLELRGKRDYHRWEGSPDIELLEKQYKNYQADSKPTALWYWEKRAGRTLLDVQTRRGAECPDLLERDEPPEEKAFLKMKAEIEEIEDQVF